MIDKLNEASRRYYDQNESDISDDEWDAMYAELRKLEEKTGERMADSPTRRVGGAVMEGFEQHRHIARLWSMDKAQSEEEILAWAQRCEKQTTEAGGLPKNSYCVEYKLDGLTVNLTYDGGRLIQAATRGNGEVGEAILPQAMTIRTIPLTIPFTGRMEVQGEGIMRLSELKKYNETVRRAAQKRAQCGCGRAAQPRSAGDGEPPFGRILSIKSAISRAGALKPSRICWRFMKDKRPQHQPVRPSGADHRGSAGGRA